VVLAVVQVVALVASERHQHLAYSVAVVQEWAEV
jgi:hypothetical protein